jgi:hypothetical protein
LEQETATHGADVFSADGREWLRLVGGSTYNSSAGNYIGVVSSTTSFVEVVGYFSGVNLIAHTDETNRHYEYKIDGGSETSFDTFETSVDTPLGSRYVDAGSVLSVVTGQTLGIHTFKIRLEDANDKLFLFGIELIVQDTTSTANRSKIQIPSQDVVSYGKKFTVSGTPHYDPFNGFTSGNLAAVQALGIDTDTSLGLSKWLPSDAATTYYRPFNGGRVVKWVDSSGVIKTSVNMMPPNAKSIANSASPTNAFATRTTASHFGTNNAMNSFEAGTDLDSDQLSEVAKIFHFREFGNGGANAGTGGANYADASMLSGGDDIAFVMDDGLSSLSADDVEVHTDTSTGLSCQNVDDFIFITFIGTGFSLKQIRTAQTPTDQYTITVDGVDVKTGQVFTGTSQFHIAQNLPYGSHIIKLKKTYSNYYSHLESFTFYQPKKPPIPEDAVVLADYMLMADFVAQTSSGAQYISKGVRRQNISRDVFCDEGDNGAFTFELNVNNAGGFALKLADGSASSDTAMTMRIPSFATNYVHRAYKNDTYAKLFIDTTDNDSNATKDNTEGYDSYAYLTNNLELGVYKFGANAANGYNGFTSGFDIATPIHTSSHYQTFETPFLHELVGGDRNMEQNNLVVSSDGKTWDEVTRNKDYLGSNLVLSATNTTNTTWDNTIVLDDWRGVARNKTRFNKDSWAIAYDRLICLKDGVYEMQTTGAFDTHQEIKINGDGAGSTLGADGTHSGITLIKELKRGDYIQLIGDFGASSSERYSHFNIKRIS